MDKSCENESDPSQRQLFAKNIYDFHTEFLQQECGGQLFENIEKYKFTSSIAVFHFYEDLEAVTFLRNKYIEHPKYWNSYLKKIQQWTINTLTLKDIHDKFSG